jgi:MFS family permease
MGRKPAIIFSDMLLMLGPALLWGSTSMKYLLVGRLLIGLGVGISIMASTIFLTESAPTKVRGAMVSCYHIMVALGIVLSFATGLLFTKWNLMFGLAIVPAFLQMLLIVFFFDETPPFLH